MPSTEGRDGRPNSSAVRALHSQVSTMGAASSELLPLSGRVSVSNCAGTWTRPSHMPWRLSPLLSTNKTARPPADMA